MENEIKEVLLGLLHPNYEKPFINKKNIKSISIKKDKVNVSIELNFPIALLSDEFETSIKEALKKVH